MLFVLPLVCAAVGIALLAWLASRVRREVDPTREAVDGLGRRVRPALLRVRDETARTRRRFDR